MQTQQVHPRLNQEELTALDQIAKQSETNRTALAASVLRAFLRAAKSQGKRIKLPPEFQIIEEPIGGYRTPDTLTTRSRKGER